jgi:hypothetical protein
MPKFVQVLLELAAKNPALLAEVLDIINRVLKLLAKYPELGPTLIDAVKGAAPPTK